jgi:hypothetical protein
VTRRERLNIEADERSLSNVPAYLANSVMAMVIGLNYKALPYLAGH